MAGLDPFSLTPQIAQAGFGYILFLFVTGILIWREKLNNDEKRELRMQVIDITEKRITDLKDIQAAAYERTKEERQFYDQSTEKIKSTMETLSQVINNMQNLLNIKSAK